MHTKLTRAASAARLERLLDALAEELAAATDEDVLQACADLGMQPQMRGSAAFFGLKGPSVSLRELFDTDAGERLRAIQAARTPATVPGPPKRKARRALPGQAGTAKAAKDDSSEK